jgi:hypothetical protein
MDRNLLQSMGLDAKSIQAMAQMDPKMLQSFGLDPNMLQQSQYGTAKSIIQYENKKITIFFTQTFRCSSTTTTTISSRCGCSQYV